MLHINYVSINLEKSYCNTNILLRLTYKYTLHYFTKNEIDRYSFDILTNQITYHSIKNLINIYLKEVGPKVF